MTAVDVRFAQGSPGDDAWPVNATGSTIALDAPTLAALESIQAAVTGTVALDAPTLAALENIVVSGVVALDAPTLAALETINAAVTGTVELGATTLAALETITVLIQSGQVVGLDAATLAALESITVSGTVALDATTLATLETINAAVTGTVALDGPTLAALENITAAVTGTVGISGPIALDSATLAALESIQASVAGTVALDSPTIAALQSVVAVVSGAVAITNFPASYPLPNSQVTALTPQTNALTDGQLRASDVNTADSGEREYIHVPFTVTNTGDTTIYTPASGKAVRLRAIQIGTDPLGTTFPVINVKIGTLGLYRFYGAMGKRQRKTGAANDPLVINLSSSASVVGFAILEEI